MKRPLCLLCLLFAALLAVFFTMEPPDYYTMPEGDGDRIRITGKVSRKEYSPQGGIIYLTNITNYSAESANYFQSEQTVNHREKTMPKGVVCYFADRDMAQTGSVVCIGGGAQNWRRATNPGAFDQAAYYRLQGMDLQMQNCIILEEGENSNAYEEALFKLRCHLEQCLYETLEEEQASVLAAMLLGSKKRLNQEVKELYQTAGIAHILAISGLHISFLGLFLYRILRCFSCPPKYAALLCLPLLYSYGIMCGTGASGRRAICMFMIQMGAVWTGRTYDMITALAVAALLLLLQQPLYLFDGGFQLSFGAVLGIGLLLPMLKERIFGQGRSCLSGWKKIAQRAVEGLLASVSVTLVTLPVLINSFYTVPPYAVLLNLLILPLMSLLLPAGAALLFSESLLPFLAPVSIVLCKMLLAICGLLCKLTLLLPGSRLYTGYRPGWQIICYYSLLLLALGCKGRAAKAGWPLCMSAALVALMLSPMKPPLQIHMVDVGQGDCFLIQIQGCQVLIDGGSSSEKKVGTYQILPVLRYYGVSELDYVFVTHLDMDHYSGILELLEQAGKNKSEITIRNLILPVGTKESEKRRRLAELTKAQGGRLLVMESTESLMLQEARLRCLHPLLGENVTDSNDGSLVLSIEYGSFRGLFMGDLGMGHETEILRALENEGQENIPYTLLKIAHHGSRYSTSDELLKEIRPGIGLVSSGSNNTYGHPHEETISRLNKADCSIWCTKDAGAVTVSTDGKKVWVSGYLE